MNQKKSGVVNNLRIAVVASEEYRETVDLLVRGAVRVLMKRHIEESQMQMMWAPTLMQTPLLAKSIAEAKDFDGVIIIGVAVKDDTDRYYFENAEVYRALMDVMMNFGMPISIGIVATEKISDAKRLAKKNEEDKNPGMIAAKQMVSLLTV